MSHDPRLSRLSRRRLLQTTGGLAAGAALAGMPGLRRVGNAYA